MGQVKRHKLGMALILGTIIIAATGVAALYWRLHKPVVPLTDKDTIVLADFANTTGDQSFRRCIETGIGGRPGSITFSEHRFGRKSSRHLATDDQAAD